MSSRVIKVTGISEELLTLLDAKIQRQHAAGRSEYLRELIRKDVLRADEQKPFYKTASSDEWSKRFRAWAEGHKSKAPILSKKAMRRTEIYKNRGL